MILLVLVMMQSSAHGTAHDVARVPSALARVGRPIARPVLVEAFSRNGCRYLTAQERPAEARDQELSARGRRAFPDVPGYAELYTRERHFEDRPGDELLAAGLMGAFAKEPEGAACLREMRKDPDEDFDAEGRRVASGMLVVPARRNGEVRQGLGLAEEPPPIRYPRCGAGEFYDSAAADRMTGPTAICRAREAK